MPGYEIKDKVKKWKKIKIRKKTLMKKWISNPWGVIGCNFKDVFHEEDFCSPLVLDLNGNGTNSTRLNESNVYFDMDGDGFKERTAWVESGDGLLVLDKNGNGTIDNGTELFGNFTALACGNKKQKIKSINNHFHMPWYVETDKREVA